MKWIGLTGGIACGKSAVATYLRSKGLPVVDADELAHMALRPGESSYTQVVHFFGPGILNSDKTINRKTLGELVFSDKSKLDFLEKAIHPWVQAKTQQKRKELEASGAKIAFYDVPLLFEKNLQAQFDAVIVVSCEETLQIQRLQTRNGFSIDEAKKRISAQMPIKEKVAQTPHVIQNNGSLQDLAKNTEVVLAKIK